MRGYDPRKVGNDALGDSVPPEQRLIEALIHAAGGYMTVPAGVGMAQGMLQQAPKMMASEAGALFPEQLAKMNATDFYHGSSTPGLTKNAIDPMTTSHENLFGQGLYMTDNPSVASSYAGKRGAVEALYKARLNATKGIDLEAPLEEDFKSVLMKQAGKIDDRFGNKVRSDYTPGDETSSLMQNLTHGIDTGKIKTNQDLFHHFREGIKDISYEENIPTSEWVDDFQELTDAFRSQGHQVMRHTGGMRVGGGKTPHEVAVLLDPKALMNFEQIK